MDKVYVLETEKEYKGFIYKIVFYETGYRCGYVKIDDNSLFWEVRRKRHDLQAHGGINYFRSKHPIVNELEDFHIGFDCGHSFDYIDVNACHDYFNEIPDAARNLAKVMFGRVASKEYVEEQCKQLIDQIIGVKHGN